jgi:hypothetical protein
MKFPMPEVWSTHPNHRKRELIFSSIDFHITTEKLSERKLLNFIYISQ